MSVNLEGLPPRFKVVRTDRELEMGRVDDALRAAGGQLVLLPDGTPEEEIACEAADADLLLMCYARITRRILMGATRLRAVVKYGVGIDAIDIDAARERGIPVVNVPAYAEETVAEGAFMLLMALMKRVKPIQRAMEREGWIWPEARWLGHDLAGRTLGLVGCGRIGRSMARMAQGFRMRVLAVDPHAGGHARAHAAAVRRCLDPLRAQPADAPPARGGRAGPDARRGGAGERLAR
jgi:D-3-phosphoglycerate dehydrogenase